MPADPRRPIYNLKRLNWRFSNGETHFSLTLDSVWPRRESFYFKAVATDDGRDDAFTGWQMATPGVGEAGWFDPTLRVPLLTDAEQYAFAFAAHLVHEITVVR